MVTGGSGGAIYLAQGSLNLTRCALLQNQADVYAAVYFAGSSASLIECTLAQNSAGFSGGALCRRWRRQP